MGKVVRFLALDNSVSNQRLEHNSYTAQKLYAYSKLYDRSVHCTKRSGTLYCGITGIRTFTNYTSLDPPSKPRPLRGGERARPSMNANAIQGVVNADISTVLKLNDIDAPMRIRQCQKGAHRPMCNISNAGTNIKNNGFS